MMALEAVAADGFELLCGKVIGRGMTRTVYDCNIRKDVVIKVEADDVRTHFQNMAEWFVWNHVAGTPWEKWFAPVHALSPNGRLLVMARTSPIGHSELPERVPTFLTDLKPANFGRYNGNVVCHDYGTHLLMENGMSNRTRKAVWRLNNDLSS